MSRIPPADRSLYAAPCLETDSMFAIERIALVAPGILRFTPGSGILADAAESPAIIIVDVQGNTLVLE